jgi:hypothetical protein
MIIKKIIIKLDENIDVNIAKLGIVLGIIVSILSAIMEKSLIILGLSISFICFAYLYIKRKKPEKTTNISKSVSYILIIIFFLLISSLPIILKYSEPYIIPLPFYIIISVLYAIITAEIFFINQESKLKYLPLFQILIVSLIFRLAIYFQFPSILGVDPWENSLMFNDTISSGYLPSEYMYSKFPIFPLNNVASILLTGLEYKHCLFFTTGFIELVTIIFVFLLGKIICNFKTGILASLFLSFFSFNIGYGTHSIIAMSIGITLFSAICYLLVKNHKANSIKIAIIIIILLSILILTHTIATIICLLLLFSFFIGRYLYKFFEVNIINKRTVTITLVSLFGVASIGYWMWVSGLFGYVIESIKFAFQIAQGEYLPKIQNFERINIYEFLLENIQWYIITLLLIFGVLVWLNKKNRSLERYCLLTFVGIIHLIIYIATIVGFDAIIPVRWQPFLYILLSIFICFTLIELSLMLIKTGKIITILIIFILSFTMILSNFANIDAPLYNSTHRDALEESEMNSVDFIYYTSNNETIYIDSYQSIYFNYAFDKNSNVFNSLFFNNNIFNCTGLFVVRDYSLKNYFVIQKESKKLVGYSASSLIEGKQFNLRHFYVTNKIYDCKSVSIYKK